MIRQPAEMTPLSLLSALSPLLFKHEMVLTDGLDELIRNFKGIFG
jgi:hypothetical protein